MKFRKLGIAATALEPDGLRAGEVLKRKLLTAEHGVIRLEL